MFGVVCTTASTTVGCVVVVDDDDDDNDDSDVDGAFTISGFIDIKDIISNIARFLINGVLFLLVIMSTKPSITNGQSSCSLLMKDKEGVRGDVMVSVEEQEDKVVFEVLE